MNKFKIYNTLFLIFICTLLTCGCENGNIFSCANSRKSISATLINGQHALNKGNYIKAINYYNDVLDKDPDNSYALYGLSSAKLKNSGLDIPDIIEKLINQSNNSQNNLIYFSSDIELSTSEAMILLKKIITGDSDGNIPPDDYDVNVNMGITQTIHALSALLNWTESTDAVEIKDDYSIVINSTPANLNAKLIETRNEILDSMQYFETAKVISSANITDIELNLNKLVDEIDTQLNNL